LHYNKLPLSQQGKKEKEINLQKHGVKSEQANEKGTGPNIISRCLICAGEHKLLVRGSTTIK